MRRVLLASHRVEPNKFRCIWCRTVRPLAEASDEHVIPEALGADERLVLRDAVCRPCNNGRLARLDQALAAEFEFIRWHGGVRGKRAHIRSYGNIVTRDGSGHGDPDVVINMSDRPRTEGEFTVGAYGSDGAYQCPFGDPSAQSNLNQTGQALHRQGCATEVQRCVSRGETG